LAARRSLRLRLPSSNLEIERSTLKVTNNSSAPVAGANSFTEGQAKSRIEAGGYSNVTELKKDDSGVWRGKGMKDGKSVTVSVDFQGNVIAR
jgi:hypothetical protein